MYHMPLAFAPLDDDYLVEDDEERRRSRRRPAYDFDESEIEDSFDGPDPCRLAHVKSPAQGKWAGTPSA